MAVDISEPSIMNYLREKNVSSKDEELKQLYITEGCI